MLYNESHKLPLSTAGKVTVLTTLMGVLVFAFIFLLNLGSKEFKTVEAQSTATTSVTVLNTPPQWTELAYEQTESSTSTPTNSGDTVTWVGTATDSNSENYQLLICSTNATPTPGTSVVDPQCGAGATLWAVSASTASGVQASAATTTTEAFVEENDWVAWICDAIDTNARCNSTYSTGLNATNSSPFYVNHRPTFTLFYDDSPAGPGSVVNFYASSSDADVIDTADTLQLVVCNDPDYNTSTNQCGAGGTLATSTLSTGDQTASYTIVIPTQDQDYTAYGYIVDEHGHEATGATQGSDSTLSVSNVAPSVSPAAITLNGGSDITLTQEAGETTGFTLQFTATDNNSCENASAGDEITGYILSVFRSGVGSSTCDGTSGSYNANNCYPSGVSSAIWNLSCTASSTSCTGPSDTTQIYDCTFPLWYIADSTDGTSTVSYYNTENWVAAVSPIDDDFATGTYSVGSTGQELNSLLAMALNTATIPYGELEPGTDTGTLSATTTVAATGNVGLDQELSGASMCPTYSGVTPCTSSATSTIPDFSQEFGTSALSYGSGTDLSSTTPQELELNVLKSQATSTQATGITYWGIAVPGTITLAGLYTGENTFTAVASEPAEWGL
ncbi:hypothetical protein KC722_02610 [Candidatus Kaiserbacteria bacterium]|nr:hypothetical protein [Candidatus Kaiserbacteria bacterium]MCB9811899.1 hypothetical protein [Candidatus Nomurabacteria bacterium]